MSAKKREVTGTLEGGRVLDGPAHLLSRVLQSLAVHCLSALHTPWFVSAITVAPGPARNTLLLKKLPHRHGETITVTHLLDVTSWILRSFFFVCRSFVSLLLSSVTLSSFTSSHPYLLSHYIGYDSFSPKLFPFRCHIQLHICEIWDSQGDENQDDYLL